MLYQKYLASGLRVWNGQPEEGAGYAKPSHARGSIGFGGTAGRVAALAAAQEDSPGAGVASAHRSQFRRGHSDTAVAQVLRTTRATVGKWRRRFIANGCDGLLDEPRPGTPRSVGDDDVERVVVRTLESVPRGATQ